MLLFYFFFSSRRRHTRCLSDWSSDVCSSDLTGGNLAEILDNLAHVVRERFKILRQVRVHTAHGRFTGYVLLGLPATLAVALSFINPEHMNLLFREQLGRNLLAAAITMQIIGFLWIRKI